MIAPLTVNDDFKVDAGFTCQVDQATAVRQFQMSLGVIVVIGMAIVTAVVTLGTTPKAAHRVTAYLPGPLIHAERMVPHPGQI